MKNTCRNIRLYTLAIIASLMCVWGNVAGQLITSPPKIPSGHPRLFILPSQIAEIKSKINKPEFYLARNAVYSSSAPACKAFKYLMEKNPTDGKSALNGAYNWLKGATVYGDNRAPFKAVFNAAIAFDYCYDLFGQSGVPSKSAFISEMQRVISLGPGSGSWAPVSNSLPTIVGHFVEGVFYNQVFAGIAMYGDNNSYYDAAIDFILKRLQPENEFWFASHMHHQGAYIGTRFSHIVLTALAFNTLTGGKDIFPRDMHYVPYQLIYAMRPDRQLLRIGDVSDDAGTYDYNGFITRQIANYFNDPYLYWLDEQGIFRDYNKELENYLFELLYRPANPTSKSVANLPLTKYFPEPIGGDMIARTGWDIRGGSEDALVHMRIGNYYFGNHQHKDFGTFQIYYKGNLTGDSGMYGGSKSRASSSFWKNYYRSTIAHNGLLIINPNEKYTGGSWTNTTVGGGMRWPLNSDVQPDNMTDFLKESNGYKMAEVIAHDFGPDTYKPEYSFISGDLTDGYNYSNGLNKDKVEKVTRSMVTLNTEEDDVPVVFMVFDRIIATDPSFKKVFLMHSLNKASISGNKTTIMNGGSSDGKLTSYTMLPENPSFSTTSGYVIGGVSYDPGTKSNGAYEDMKWRVEVSPSTSSKEDEFFHVMTASDASTNPPTPEKIINDKLVGAKIFDRVTLFNREGGFIAQAQFDIDGPGSYKTLVCDLTPGQWQVEKDGKVIGTYKATREGHTISFRGEAGHYKITNVQTGLYVMKY